MALPVGGALTDAFCNARVNDFCKLRGDLRGVKDFIHVTKLTAGIRAGLRGRSGLARAVH